MHALACPGALKGVLSSRAAGAALAEGFARAGIECEALPLADGGEGTLDVLGGEARAVHVHDPLGREVEAHWRLLLDGRAVIESAQAIGLSRLAYGERNPWEASSRGLGELIRVAAQDARALIVGLGDSATVDGGAGLREVLAELPLPTTALCDVRNPLLDAARVFSRQKGASLEQVAELEARLVGMEELAPFAEVPGAGAAGGLGAALAALGATLVPGAEYVIDAVGLRKRIRRADLVVTGEGLVDATSLEGKLTASVVGLCADEVVPCVVFGGRVEVELPTAEMHALSGDPSRAREDLVELGERLAGSA